MIAKPLTTIPSHQLIPFLTDLYQKERVSTTVVGHPITMHGAKSSQTILIEKMFDTLQHRFPHSQWVLWDERLSSKRAASISNKQNRAEKQKEHARAAAFILDLYLTYCSTASADPID